MVREFEPCIRIRTDGVETPWDVLFLLLSAPPLHMLDLSLSLSLSLKKKKKEPQKIS